ncbi:hypothetical protein AQJ23_15430 [Streptomyces antibioticus]|nr:hypothetical protein AQJ23_15430 [Streptomyces antibioticus]
MAVGEVRAARVGALESRMAMWVWRSLISTQALPSPPPAVGAVPHHRVQCGHGASRVHHVASGSAETIQVEGDDAYGDVVGLGEFDDAGELSPRGGAVADADAERRFVQHGPVGDRVGALDDDLAPHAVLHPAVQLGRGVLRIDVGEERPCVVPRLQQARDVQEVHVPAVAGVMLQLVLCR